MGWVLTVQGQPQRGIECQYNRAPPCFAGFSASSSQGRKENRDQHVSEKKDN